MTAATAPLPIEAVIFDMDGLLLDTEALAMEALMSAGLEVGTEMPRAFCHGMIGRALDQCRAMIVERYGADFPLDRYFALQDAHLNALVASGRMELKAGVVPLLDELDRLGLKRAVATSSGRGRALHHLEVAGIVGRFERIVTRDDVSRGKPDPEPYLTAAAGLGVRPEACLALEDSHTGVRAAHAAGMRVIMVPDLLQPTEEMHDKAHRIVQSLHEVIAFLNEGS
jgi:HAD superfamily hydrolase (TIGR01509 family)